MYFKNCTMEQLREALDVINKEYFNGNVRFNRLEQLSKNRIVATLCVNDSHGKGAKLGIAYFMGYGSHPRHTVNACWHAHGYLFDAILAINPSTVITTLNRQITIDSSQSERWRDWNIGSMANPVNFSECCECGRHANI